MTPAFTIVEDVIAPGTETQHHLIDHQTQALLTTLWTTYLRRVRSALPPTGVHPALRRVTYSLEHEAFPGQPLQRGIRVLGRSRRSCTFAAALWHPSDGRMVHVAEMVTVFVDPAASGAVEIPTDFWEEVEHIEGRTINVPDAPGSV